MRDLGAVTALILPTFNPGAKFLEWCQALERQDCLPRWIYVIDSSSSDDTAPAAAAKGFQVHIIPKADFDHGGTRQLGVELVPQAEFVVFMTQDAILAHPETLGNLLASFNDPEVGAAYGRQLPRPGATPIEAHSRYFHYPDTSRLKSFQDRFELGIKTAAISNSFAAYRRIALMSVGGFPQKIIFGEDNFVSAQMLKAGWKIAYCAEAKVFHSHNYKYFEEFSRYFDIGVYYARYLWISQLLGKVKEDGLTYVLSELKYLKSKNPLLIPSAMSRTILKFIAYQLGNKEKYLPLVIKRKVSMNQNFWVNRLSQDQGR